MARPPFSAHTRHSTLKQIKLQAEVEQLSERGVKGTAVNRPNLAPSADHENAPIGVMGIQQQALVSWEEAAMVPCPVLQ